MAEAPEVLFVDKKGVPLSSDPKGTIIDIEVLELYPAHVLVQVMPVVLR